MKCSLERELHLHADEELLAPKDEILDKDQDVDIRTKALTRSKFEYHRGRIGVDDNPYLVEREC